MSPSVLVQLPSLGFAGASYPTLASTALLVTCFPAWPPHWGATSIRNYYQWSLSTLPDRYRQPIALEILLVIISRWKSPKTYILVYEGSMRFSRSMKHTNENQPRSDTGTVMTLSHWCVRMLRASGKLAALLPNITQYTIMAQKWCFASPQFLKLFD